MEAEKKNKVKKALSLAGNILIYVFCAICIVMVIITITNKKDSEDAVNVFGYQMRIVLTGSMEKNEETWDDIKGYKIKSIKKDSMVFVKSLPDDDAEWDDWYASLKEGDVLTFKYVAAVKQEVITHRIKKIEPYDRGGYVITLQGDNGDDIPQTIYTAQYYESPNFVLGKVVGSSYFFGKFINVLKTPLGMSLIVIVPCAIIIIFQVITIVNVVNTNKRKKAEEEAAQAAEIAQQRLDEMEELKRRLAELESSKKATAPEQSAPPADGPPSTDGNAE